MRWDHEAEYAAVFARLDKVSPYGQTGHAWRACCPSHGDRTPSLSLWIGQDGELRAKCHSNKGCTFRSILEASRTNLVDWLPSELRQRFRERGTERSDSEGRKKLESPLENQVVATYQYFSPEGELVFQVVRLVGVDGKKTFRQRQPDPGEQGNWKWGLDGIPRPLPLYNTLEVARRPKHPVFVVEGEKDADRLTNLNLVAVTNAGGAGKWDLAHGKLFKDRRVVVIPDHDRPGYQHAALVVGSLVLCGATSIKVLRLPGLSEGGDVSDWLASLGNLSEAIKRERLIDLVRKTPEWKPV